MLLRLMLTLCDPKAVASGALLQTRILGGALGLAITSNVLTSYLKSSLAGVVSTEELSTLLQSTSSIRLLSPHIQDKILVAFSDGYNLQMKIMTGFAGAQLLAVGAIWRKQQISVVEEKAKPDPDQKTPESVDREEKPGFKR